MNNIPHVFEFDGKNLLQLQSTKNSGLYKFCDVEDRELIYLYEIEEIPVYERQFLEGRNENNN